MDPSAETPARLRRLPSWLLSHAALAGDRLVSAALATEGVRKYHFRVLVALSEHGALSQADLGRRLAIDRSDMVAVVAELERSGHVRRSRDQRDRRRNVVARTDAGGRALERMQAAVDTAQSALLEPLTATERRQLTRLLTRLVERRD
jgi:MarR family transcriptional regulator, lower aerobic nicotinate degradation pathway regulator